MKNAEEAALKKGMESAVLHARTAHRRWRAIPAGQWQILNYHERHRRGED